VLESFPWPWDLFMACDCVKRLVFKGLAVGQAYLMKKVSKLFSFLLAISPRHAIVSSVASATHNTKKIPR
jgi:hypothetical protein